MRAAQIGILFQDDALLPWKTARDNVALGLTFNGMERSKALAEAEAWLERLGSCGLRRPLSPPPQRRPAQARRARPGAGDEAEAHPDGRAVRLARCDRARPRGAGRRRAGRAREASAFSWSPTISKRRSASPTTSTCCRRDRARASRSNTRCRFRGRAIRSHSRMHPAFAPLYERLWADLSREVDHRAEAADDAARSPLRLDAPARRLRGPARGLGGGRPRRHAQSDVCAEPEPDRRGAHRAVLRRPHLAASRGDLHRRARRSRARHRRRHSARRRRGARSASSPSCSSR